MNRYCIQMVGTRLPSLLRGPECFRVPEWNHIRLIINTFYPALGKYCVKVASHISLMSISIYARKQG